MMCGRLARAHCRAVNIAIRMLSRATGGHVADDAATAAEQGSAHRVQNYVDYWEKRSDFSHFH